ncbi:MULTISPECIES: helix-turn-helix domain-containing protein [unclassified Aeromicrobium]|uniref:helix-turn-helix domain-containing protein n=1 Tax=unclassified Aeromicrobium TaxID=2633570 RepID=UPI00396B47F4
MTELLTTEEVAKIARTTPGTVRYWFHSNRGPRSLKVGRRRLYDRADVEAWLDAAKAAS